jgi:ribosome biogenesis GTPase
VLERIGYHPRMARWAGAEDASIVRVASLDDGIACVLSERGPLRASLDGALLARMAADHRVGPCPGDWCVARSWPDHHVTLGAVLPRSTVVRAPDGDILCANADLVGLVLTPSAAPDPERVREAVTWVQASTAAPLVIVVDADPDRTSGGCARRLAERLPGVEVLVVGTRSGRGLASLRDRLAGGLTLALVGPASHERSDLVDALVGAGRLTTGVGVVPLPSGGAVVDTVTLPWEGSRPPGRAAGARTSTSRSRP